MHADDLLARTSGADREHKAALLSELGVALEAQDPYLDGHSRRVGRYATMIARRMGLAEERVARVQAAAAVHDIGKLRIPAEILYKPGRLTEEEFERTKRHAGDGGAMIERLGDGELAAVVRAHHERWDGGGYPDGVAGERIPVEARIISVADTFDAITTTRPYRPADHHERALAVIAAEAGKQLDPTAARAFISCYTDRRGIAAWAIGAWIAAAPRSREFATAASSAVAAAVVAVAVAAAGGGSGVTGKPPADVAGAAVVRGVSPPVATATPSGAASPASGHADPPAHRRHPRTRTGPAPAAVPSPTPPPSAPAAGARPAPSTAPTPARTPAATRAPTATPPPAARRTPHPAPTVSPPPQPTAPAPPPPTSNPTPAPTPTAMPTATATPAPTAAPRPPHTVQDCLNGGWIALGYANQGQCIADANGPTPTPTP